MATGAGILLVTLGIGVTSSIFSVFSALFLRPLTFPESDRLVQLETVHPEGLAQWVSDRHYVHWRDNSTVFESLAAYMPPQLFNLQGDFEAETVRGTLVSGSFFETFGLEMTLGSGFTHQEPLMQPTEVVLGHGLWLKRFGGDPDALGRQIQLGGMSLTVVGLLSPRISPPFGLELWLPLAVDTFSDRGNLLRVTGRLQRGVRLESAQAEMDLVHQQGLELAGMQADLEGVSVRTFQEFRYGSRKPTMLLLLSASGFVLLLACTNVSNLQLSRMATRTREIAIRQTLGASTARLLRPLVVETLLLVSAGATLGTLVSLLINQWLVASAPAILASAPALEIDGRVLSFVVGVAILAAFLSAIFPAFQAARTGATGSLRERSGASPARATGRISRQVLVSAEIAVTLLAVLTATLLIKSYGLLGTVDPGFEPNNVIAMELAGSSSGDADALELQALTYELLPLLEALPGVSSVGASTSLPVESLTVLPYIDADRYVPGPSREGQAAAQYRGINTTYLETMGIPLLRGRRFTAGDRDGSPGVVLISESAATRHWPNEDPIGKRVSIFPDSIYAGQPRTVVGIVGDVSELALGESRRWDSLYVPLTQMPGPLGKQLLGQVFVVLKSDAEPLALVPAMKERIWSLNAAQPIRRVRSMDEVLRQSLKSEEFNTVAASGFAVLSLILGGVGIYGVFSFLAASRNQELAIRIALGSTRSQLMRLILRQGIWALAIGVSIGLSGAFAARRIAGSLLYGVTATDPSALLIVILVLVGMALSAMLLPAWKAAKVDPMLALRQE